MADIQSVPPLAVLVTLGAAFLHAGWNAALKGSAEPRMAAIFLSFGSAIVILPALLIVPAPAPASWPYILASGVIHVAYFEIIGRAYRSGELSAVYPLMRGGAPLMTTLAAVALFGDRPSLAALGGVLCIAAGIAGLAWTTLRRKGLDGRTLALVGGMACVISAYTLADGQGARLSGSPVGYLAWMSIATALMLVPFVWPALRDAPLAHVRRHLPRGLAVGVLSGAAYAPVLWAMTVAPIGVVSALRETSVLFALALAAILFRERIGLPRAVAASLIVGGIAAIRLA